MTRRSRSPIFELAEVAERLRHAKNRIVQCINWARSTEEVWRAFNVTGPVRQAVAASPASQAARIYERAARDAQIMMITRVFDPAGRGGALASNRLSFPVCRDLLALPGVLDFFLQDALGSGGDRGEAASQAVSDAAEAFRVRLSALECEEAPNRADVIRHFRDDNIAHELHRPADEHLPLYKYVPELLDEATALAERLAFVVERAVIFWPTSEAERSSKALWSAVAKAHPLTAPPAH